jgi:thiamine pyrophosphate-dependent acetolactate synthase large subunit-like protein
MSDICKNKIYLSKNKLCVTKKNINYQKHEEFFSNFFIKLLISIGVKSAIGIPGSELFKLYISMINNNIDVIIARNEMSASFAPIGAASVCKNRHVIDRKFCMAFASDGPGAINLMSGVSQATTEKVPSIYIINRNINKDNDNRVIQQVDTPSMYKNISKSILEIDKDSIENSDIIQKIYDTLVLGFSYPTGSIVFFMNGDCFDVDITKHYKNVNLNIYVKKFSKMFKHKYGYEMNKEIIGPNYITGLYTSEWMNKKMQFIKSNEVKIINNYKNFLENTIKKSKTPIFLFGEGCGDIDLNKLYINLCHKLQIPYLLTTAMKKFVDSTDIFYAESCGHYGTYCGNMSIYNADLLICIGTSFNLYMTIDLLEPFKNVDTIISINTHPELYNTPFVNYYIIEDGKKVIKSINNINISNYKNNYRDNWLNQIQEFKKIGHEKIHYFYSNDINETLRQGDIYSVIQEKIDNFHKKHKTKQIYFVVDAGSSQLFSTSLLNFKNRYHLISSLKWGAIGDGIGLVIGAAIKNPNDLFILIAGDGGSFLSISDYITIKEANIKNVIIIIIENGGLSLVSEELLSFSSKTLEYGNGYKMYPNWVSLFNGLKLSAAITKTKNEFDCTFENIIKNKVFKETIVIVAVVSMDLYYAPMVPIGSSCNNMKYIVYNENDKIDKCRISTLQ